VLLHQIEGQRTSLQVPRVYLVVQNLISLVKLNQASLQRIKDLMWYSQHEEQHLTSLNLKMKQPLQKIQSLKEDQLLAQIS
jgi:hypothetical protein